MDRPEQDNHAILTQEELDALQKVSSRRPRHGDRDRFFLLKLQLLLCLGAIAGTLMLLVPEQVVYWFHFSVNNSETGLRTIVLRGIFVWCYVLALGYAWVSERRCDLLVGSAAIMASANLFLDLPYLLRTDFSHSFMNLGLALALRLTLIALLVSVYLNLPRSTYLPRRLLANPFRGI